MKKLVIKEKFHVKQRTPEKRKVTSLHLSAQLDQAVEEAAQDHEVTKQDLIRQMVTHCLRDLGHDVTEDTDSPPPTRRQYKKHVSKLRQYKKHVSKPKRKKRAKPPPRKTYSAEGGSILTMAHPPVMDNCVYKGLSA